MGSLKTLVIKTYWKIYNLEEIVKYQQDKKWINKHFCVLTAAETLVMETEATAEVVIVLWLERIITWASKAKFSNTSFTNCKERQNLNESEFHTQGNRQLYIWIHSELCKNTTLHTEYWMLSLGNQSTICVPGSREHWVCRLVEPFTCVTELQEGI